VLGALQEGGQADAVAILRLEDNGLIPERAEGLAVDAIPRRYRVINDLRLKASVEAPI